MSKQQLHPQANAKEWPSQFLDALDQSGGTQSRHGVAGRTDSGQHDPTCEANLGRIGAHQAAGAEPIEGVAERSKIGAAAVDDQDFCLAHSTPFVLGSSRPSRRSAGRKARPTPLKQASIM